MKSLIDAVDGLPLIIKLILCIPCVAIFWQIYRIARSLQANNLVGVVIAIVLIIVGIPFMWLVDLICLLLNKKVWWID